MTASKTIGVTLFADVIGAPACCIQLNGHVSFISRPSQISLWLPWVLQIQPILVASVSETTQRTFLEQQQNLCNIHGCCKYNLFLLTVSAKPHNEHF